MTVPWTMREIGFSMYGILPYSMLVFFSFV